MSLRGLAPVLGIVFTACGGAQPARTCDQLARRWQPNPAYVGDSREVFREQCREEHWEPTQIACMDRRGENAAEECLGREEPMITDPGEECRTIRVALRSVESRFAQEVGARLSDDEAAGVSYLQSNLRWPGMDCAIKDEYAIEKTMLVCERSYDDAGAADDEYARLRALIEPPCLDETWQSLESTVEGIDYTQWSEGVGLDAPHVLLTLAPPDDAGQTLVRVYVANRMDR